MEKQPTIVTAKMLRTQVGIARPGCSCFFFGARGDLEEDVPLFLVAVETALFFWTAAIGLVLRDVINQQSK